MKNGIACIKILMDVIRTLRRTGYDEAKSRKARVVYQLFFAGKDFGAFYK